MPKIQPATPVAPVKRKPATRRKAAPKSKTKPATKVVLRSSGDVTMLDAHQPADLVVTYSELDSFRQCPLKHQWSYRDKWVMDSKTGTALSRGSLWHLVMECHYTWIQRFKDKGVTLTFLRQWIAQHLLFDQTGQQDEDQELVEWMYDGYLDCYGTEDRWEIILIEFAGQVALPAPDGGPPIDLRFKIDLLIRDRQTGQLWLVDHKSARDFSRQTEVDLDDQFGLYTWALRLLGWPVVGTIRSDARTQRNKRPMSTDQRFRQVFTYRTDTELDNIARDAYVTARAAWYPHEDRMVYSSPLTFTCSWRCSFVQPHLEIRKGTADEETVMRDFGFRRNDKKHREYDTDPVLERIPKAGDTPDFTVS